MSEEEAASGLIVRGVPADSTFVAAIKAALLAAGWPPGESPDGRLTVCASVDDFHLRAYLTPPACGCLVECKDWQRMSDLLAWQDGTVWQLLCLLPAGQAFALSVSKAFANAIADRVTLESDMLELAIHEAVANAVLHGALDVGHYGLEADPDLGRYNRTLIAALENAERASRPVLVRARMGIGPVEVTVADSGPGFAVPGSQDFAGDPQTPTGGEGARRFGRGLNLIAEIASSLRFEDGGRRTVMLFDRRDA